MNSSGLTDNNQIDNIKLNDKVSVLVVKVRNIIEPIIIQKTIPIPQRYQFFTFVVQNNQGRKIQCNVYGDAVNLFISKVQQNAIICIKGAVAKKPDGYNNGNTPFLLILDNSAEILSPENFATSSDHNAQFRASRETHAFGEVSAPGCRTSAKLKIFYQNVRGINGKRKEVLSFTDHSDYDMIALTETWLQDRPSYDFFDREKYEVFRRDRDHLSMRGGGVLLAVKKSHPACELNLRETQNGFPTVEILGTTVRYEKVILKTIVVYIPPRSKNGIFDDIVRSITENANDIGGDLLILGDFNVPIFCKEMETDALGKKPLSIFKMMDRLGLQQFNNVTNCHGQCLDLVFSNVHCEIRSTNRPIVKEERYHPAFSIDVNLNTPVGNAALNANRDEKIPMENRPSTSRSTNVNAEQPSTSSNTNKRKNDEPSLVQMQKRRSRDAQSAEMMDAFANEISERFSEFNSDDRKYFISYLQQLDSSLCTSDSD